MPLNLHRFLAPSLAWLVPGLIEFLKVFTCRATLTPGPPVLVDHLCRTHWEHKFENTSTHTLTHVLHYTHTLYACTIISTAMGIHTSLLPNMFHKMKWVGKTDCTRQTISQQPAFLKTSIWTDIHVATAKPHMFT